MFSAVNFEPLVNVLHCILSVTYTFKNMLLLGKIHIIKYSILACYVWLEHLNWRGTKPQSSFSFFYYYFYYSIVYIDSSLHVNQDREVDSGLELCCKCSRMRVRGRERVGEENTVLHAARLSDWISMWFNFWTRILSGSKPNQNWFSSYCTTDRQTDAWIVEGS